MTDFDWGTEDYWRLKIAQEIRQFRLDTEEYVDNTTSGYLTGLLRAEIIASGQGKHAR